MGEPAGVFDEGAPFYIGRVFGEGERAELVLRLAHVVDVADVAEIERGGGVVCSRFVPGEERREY